MTTTTTTTEKLPRAWRNAASDLVASAIHHIVQRYSREYWYSPSAIGRIKRKCGPAKRHGKAVREAIRQCLPEAMRLFQMSRHSEAGVTCRCRAYCILQANARATSKCEHEAHELYLDGKKRFDRFMDSRS